MKMNYPDDGGLKEQVRPLSEAFSGFEMLRRHFTQVEPERRGDYFRRVRVPFLYFSAHNMRYGSGHKRLFGDKPGKGWAFYQYGRQVSGNAEWAFHRRWNFAFFCVHHVGPGKATDPQGWHVTWSKLKFAKVYGGFSVQWLWADTFSTKKR